VSRLAVLGLIAGAPAIVGAWIGAAAFNPSIGAFLFGIGAGAIVQVIRQLWPGLRDAGTRSLSPGAVPALLSGSAVMYATSLLVSV
jgi:zinc transporter, ZIP family